MKQWNKKNTFVETYFDGKIKIIRNFNKKGGKYFYVVDKQDKWIGKIFFDKNIGDWLFSAETPEHLSILTYDEKAFVFETLNQIRRDYNEL